MAKQALKSKSTKRKNILLLTGIVIIILLVNFIAQFAFFRIDLTSDKRYSIADVSKKVMRGLDDIIFVRVYLDGEMPVAMKKFQRAIREKLDELGYYANHNLQYEFQNPSEGNESERDAVYKSLSQKGLHPLAIQENNADGGATQRVLFPGAIVYYRGKEAAINLIQNSQLNTSEENLNFAEQNLEYNLVSTIEQISRKEKPLIAFVEGHGELEDEEIHDIVSELSNYYQVDRVELDGDVGRIDKCKAIIIAKPTEQWSEADKLVIDQYIMNGGRTAWFIDAVQVYDDSLRYRSSTFGLTANHNLNDMLFRYGVRVNANVIKDLQCAMRLINIAPPNSQADFRLAPWTYFPLLIPPDDNPVTKGLNLIRSQYPGVIDTVGMSNKVDKTFLLYSSQHSKVISAPLMINLAEAYERINEQEYNQSFLPVAALLDGEFESAFQNRMVSQYNNGEPFDFKAKSKPTKMVVVSDGDIIRNDVIRYADRLVPLTLGYDREMKQYFGNKEFVKNVINYIADESDLMQIRNYDYVLRLLDKPKVINNRTNIILVNTVFPVVLVVLCGVVFIWWRRRRYTR